MESQAIINDMQSLSLAGDYYHITINTLII
jgi:hypothetical protein